MCHCPVPKKSGLPQREPQLRTQTAGAQDLAVWVSAARDEGRDVRGPSPPGDGDGRTRVPRPHHRNHLPIKDGALISHSVTGGPRPSEGHRRQIPSSQAAVPLVPSVQRPLVERETHGQLPRAPAHGPVQ